MRFWPFRKPPPPPHEDRRDNSDDWRPGDLAECLVHPLRWARMTPHNPGRGDILRVTDVRDEIGYGHGQMVRCIFLSFEGKPDDLSWESKCFRKIRPTYEPADRSFIERLKNGLPVRMPDPVGA